MAGVSETIRSGRAGIVTAVPSSSVRVRGNAAAGVGAGVGAGAAAGVGAGVGSGRGGRGGGRAAGGHEGAQQGEVAIGRAARAARDGVKRTGTSLGREGVAARGRGERAGTPNGREAPRWRESCLPAPFSRGFERLHRGAGDRTSVPEGTVTVAGLCRILTGFATTRWVVTGGA